MMKQKILALLCAFIMVLGGCAQSTQEQEITEQIGKIKFEQVPELPISSGQSNSVQPIETTGPGFTTEQSGEGKNEQITEMPKDVEQPTATPLADDISTEELTITGSYLDDEIYLGEYLDSDVNEPNLEIAKGDDGRYIVQIGIFRLASLDDGIGELTAEGLVFTATDSVGNPISGVITVEGQTATVTFTNSTWDYLPNAAAFQYTKSSDIPNIWGQ